jgi:hypothetical protein
VEGHRGRRLQLLAIEGREDAHNVIGTGRGLDYASTIQVSMSMLPRFRNVFHSLLINGLHELTDDKRYTLDALDLFLCSDQLSL